MENKNIKVGAEVRFTKEVQILLGFNINVKIITEMSKCNCKTLCDLWQVDFFDKVTKIYNCVISTTKGQLYSNNNNILVFEFVKPVQNNTTNLYCECSNQIEKPVHTGFSSFVICTRCKKEKI